MDVLAEMERVGEAWKLDPWRPVRRRRIRYSDTEARLIADLGKDHGLAFMPTAKDDQEAEAPLTTWPAAAELERIDIGELEERLNFRLPLAGIREAD